MFYYVPFFETLKNLLPLEDFQSGILNPHENCFDEKLYDFCDGTIFKSHLMFSVVSNMLQIVAYYDKLKVVNPIGSYINSFMDCCGTLHRCGFLCVGRFTSLLSICQIIVKILFYKRK